MQTSQSSPKTDEMLLSPLSWRRPDGTLMHSDPVKERCYGDHIRRVAQHLSERYSSSSFHQDRAASCPGYWLDMAESAPNLLPGNPYQI